MEPVIRLSIVVAFTSLLAATPVAAQSQNQGLEQRVTALENVVGILNEQVTTLRQLVSTLQQAVAAQSQQLASHNQQLTALENLSQPFNINVNCANGETVANAIQQANRRTGFVSIRIIGTCTEAVGLSRSNTTLRGASPGDGLQAPSPLVSPLKIAAGQGIVLDQMTLTGGQIGLVLDSETQVSVRNSVITGSSFHGIFVNNGTLAMFQTIVDGAGGAGVFAWNGSKVKMTGGTIKNSGERGLELHIGAVAQVQGGAQIMNNHTGIGAWFGAVINVRDASVVNNFGDGITANGGATVLLGTGTLVDGNQFNGISLRDTSVAGSFGSADITNHGKYGVTCSATPGVAQLSGSLGNVSANGMGQVNCPTSPNP